MTYLPTLEQKIEEWSWFLSLFLLKAHTFFAFVDSSDAQKQVKPHMSAVNELNVCVTS